MKKTHIIPMSLCSILLPFTPTAAEEPPKPTRAPSQDIPASRPMTPEEEAGKMKAELKSMVSRATAHNDAAHNAKFEEPYQGEHTSQFSHFLAEIEMIRFQIQ